MSDTITVGWLILGDNETPYKKTAAPKIYSSFSRARATAKMLKMDDPSFVKVSFNPDNIRYSEYLGCPNWPNCDVVGCH